MTRLVWNNPEQRRYESGVDRGVLYLDGSGVPWNGLTSVEETSVGGEVEAFYFDGIKYLEKTKPKHFQATITAFSAPKEFAPCVGELPVIPGFILTRQPRRCFGFSYRTLVDGGDNYKIHIVYNATASLSSRGYSTLTESPEPTSLSWTVDAVPPKVSGYRPSAHFTLDTTKTDLFTLRAIEDVLYGTATSEPRLPSVEELVDIVGLWEPTLITPAPIYGLALLSQGPKLSKTFSSQASWEEGVLWDVETISNSIVLAQELYDTGHEATTVSRLDNTDLTWGEGELSGDILVINDVLTLPIGTPGTMSVTETFEYTGSEQTWVVPEGVTSVDLNLYGAQGGGPSGGLGGQAYGTLLVTPGETLRVYVGGQGGGTEASLTGFGGGGGTDIRQAGSALSNRKIVAGGGGGQAVRTGVVTRSGGAGGGTTGIEGSYGSSQSYTGQPGTQTAGGAAGSGSSTAGALGVGGNGALGTGNTYGWNGGGTSGYSASSSLHTGGGGGGYYGGGGATGVATAGSTELGAGGGGSGYVGGVTSSGMNTGVRSGNGLATITYEVEVPPVQYSGSRVSPATTLSLETVDSSHISWTSDIPEGTSVLVEVSVDGGANWVEVSSGDPIPALISTSSIKTRVSLASNVEGTLSPTVYSLSVVVEQNEEPPTYRYINSGLWSSPPIDISNIKETKDSSIIWETTASETTSVLIETSIDGGVSWSEPILGEPIPGLSAHLDLTGMELNIRATLYGTDLESPVLSVVRINVLGPDLNALECDLTRSTTEGLYRALPTTRLIETAVGGLYRLE